MGTHSGKVRGLLLCIFISILQVEVYEIGQKCPRPALRSQLPKPCQGQFLCTQSERGCPRSLHRAVPVSSDTDQEMQRQKKKKEMQRQQ